MSADPTVPLEAPRIGEPQAPPVEAVAPESEVVDQPEAEAPDAEEVETEAPPDPAQQKREMDRYFTQTAQQLAAQKRELETRARDLEARMARLGDVDQVEKLLAENPDVQEELTDLLARHGKKGSRAQRTSEVDTRIETMQKSLEELKVAHAEQVLTYERSRLAREYNLKPAEVDAVFEVASDPEAPMIHYGMTPGQVSKALDKAYKVAQFPKAAAAGQRKMLNQVEKKRAAATSGASAAPVSSPPVDVSKLSWEETRDYAKKLAREGVGGRRTGE